MKKIVITVVIILTALISLGFYLQLAGKVISSGDMKDSTSNFGYEIGNRSYRNGTWIKIWSSRGLDFNFYDSKLKVAKIVEERWIGNNRAIYLNLDLIAAKDSYSEQRTAKILFDYRRGEIYITSVEPLWRTGQRFEYNVGDKLWLSEEAFQSVLSGLENQSN